MPATVLIPTSPGDLHAGAVALALRHKGAVPVPWLTPDFPTRTGETLAFESGRLAIRVQGPGVDLGGDLSGNRIDSVWNRRPAYAIDPGRLHAADRPFAERSCEIFRRSLFELLVPGAFWVNPEPAVRRDSKPRQHAAAVAVGLETPDTLYTNDPEEIRGFLRRQGGRIVYKPLLPALWKAADEVVASYTSVLTEEMLVEDELLRSAPGIFQALLPKAWELRITVMGHHVLGARVLSQETASGRLDWRKSYGELRMEPCAVEADLAARCVELLERLGLVFGCFDFVVTPDGRTVFLEVNQMGQFLFVEEYTGQPLLDAFAELLIQGRPDFAWSPERAGIRFSDVVAEAEESCRREERDHVPAPTRAWDETAEPAK